jgi:hypothetical protein
VDNIFFSGCYENGYGWSEGVEDIAIVTKLGTNAKS